MTFRSIRHCGGYCSRTDSFFIPIQRFRPASRHRLGHGDTVLRIGPHLPHRWPGRRPEPSDLQYRRRYTSATRLSDACLPFDTFLDYAEAGVWASLPARSGSQRKDDYVASWTASIQRKLPWNILATATYLGNKGTDVLTTTYTTS